MIDAERNNIRQQVIKVVKAKQRETLITFNGVKI